MVFNKNQILFIHEELSKLLKYDYFDLRIEIVDHMMSIMEKRQLHQPDFSFLQLFNEALYDMGGKKGLREIEFDRKYQLWKVYLKKHLLAAVDAFQWPYVMFSIVSIAMLYRLTIMLDSGVMVYFFACCLVGIAEMMDRVGKRGWINDMGTSISSFPIYARSAFVTNLPIILALASHHFIDHWIVGNLLTAAFAYIWIVFFVFRFYFLRSGVIEDLRKYRLIHQQLMA